MTRKTTLKTPSKKDRKSAKPAAEKQKTKKSKTVFKGEKVKDSKITVKEVKKSSVEKKKAAGTAKTKAVKDKKPVKTAKAEKAPATKKAAAGTAAKPVKKKPHFSDYTASYDDTVETKNASEDDENEEYVELGADVDNDDFEEDDPAAEVEKSLESAGEEMTGSDDSDDSDDTDDEILDEDAEELEADADADADTEDAEEDIDKPASKIKVSEISEEVFEQRLAEEIEKEHRDELRSNEDILMQLQDDDTLSEFDRQRMWDDVARKNMKLVYYVANKISAYAVSQDEIQAVGRTGYAKAFKTYDPHRGIKFATYAINCISHEIYACLRSEQKHYKNDISMSAARSHDKNGNDLTIEDTLADWHETPEEKVRREAKNKLIREVLNNLSPIEKYVLYVRFGIDRNLRLTQKEVADYVGMSQANISKIERTSLETMKVLLKFSDVSDYN
jgi:RNA polymerase sporulation-specific sigma factor